MVGRTSLTYLSYFQHTSIDKLRTGSRIRMHQTSLRARWIVPVDSPPLENGVVTIVGERITGLGTSAPAGTTDLGDVVLVPGLVNAHTHGEFSDCDKPLGSPNMPLPEWIRQVIGTRHRADREPPAAIQRGMAESLRHGVTTIGEIATCPVACYADFAGSHLVLFEEVIGFSAARVESVYGDLEARVTAAASSNCAVGVSPHAPYTVHPQLLERLVALARERRLPLAMHIAESREELELLRDGTGPFQELLDSRGMWDARAIPGGSRPLDYLRRLSEAPRALVIHGNFLDAEEISFLAERRESMSLVFCPRTHAYFGHEPYPLATMLTAGVRVVLGTDSRASNPDLNVLADARYVARHHTEVSPAAVLEMCTLAAASALGLENETGSITPGKLADLVALPCPTGSSPLEAILGTDAAPTHIFVRGRAAKVA